MLIKCAYISFIVVLLSVLIMSSIFWVTPKPNIDGTTQDISLYKSDRSAFTDSLDSMESTFRVTKDTIMKKKEILDCLLNTCSNNEFTIDELTLKELNESTCCYWE